MNSFQMQYKLNIHNFELSMFECIILFLKYNIIQINCVAFCCVVLATIIWGYTYKKIEYDVKLL